MMRQLLSISLCLLGIFTSLFAQDWFPIGAKWHYNTELCNIESPSCGYYTLEVVRDTFIAGQQAKVLKVEEFGSGSLFLDSLEIVYEASHRVYRYYQGTFHLIYDLNLMSGDTLTIQDTSYVGFIPAENGEQSDTITFKVAIDSVTTLSFGGVPLAIQYSHPLEEGNANLWGFYEGIVERIGPIEQPLGMYGDITANLFRGQLRCYEDNLISWQNPNFSGECNLVTSIAEAGVAPPLKIWYAEETHELVLELPDSKSNFFSIALINVTGQSVWQEHRHRILDRQPIRVGLPSLPQGTYFVNISVGREVHTQTIMIQE
ncbi:MAG: T9SS type A sorting domain-containing protein [Bacteroidota bacterium]